VKRYVGFLLLLLWPTGLQAALTGSFSLSSEYDSNLYHTSDAESDMISHAGLRLGYEWAQKSWQESLSLEGDGFLFAGHPDRTYSRQSARAGIGWLPSSKSLVRGGLGFARRVDRDEYAMYDYQEIDGFIDGKLRIGDRGGVLAGYTFEQRHYAVLDAFDYDEHRVRVQADLPFGQRSGVVLLNEVGFKKYETSVKGKGKGAQLHQDGVLGVQWRASVRLSRPLGENTGLRISCLRRFNLGDCVKDNVLRSADYLAGEELYDDPYAYESQEYGILISRRLQQGLIFRFGYDHAFKEYRQKLVDETGHHMPGAGSRSDRLSRFSVRLEKVWKHTNDPLSVRLFAESLYQRNHSNDPLYRYKALTCTAGVGVEF
jgi:hypothetical protein